jgi:MoaA/NifB/PqqE/SkfB family radical SAM enzyme
MRSTILDVCRLAVGNRELRRWCLATTWRRLLHGREHLREDGRSSPPSAISLRPTFLCNLDCKMCSFANSASAEGEVAITGEKDFLPLEIANRLIDDVAPHRPCVSVTGGEPLLWKPLFDFLAHTRQRGVMTSVTTNGTLLARRAEELRNGPPDVLIVSVLGGREHHDEIVGRRGAYDDLVAGLRLVNEGKGGRRLARPLIVLNTPLLMENAECVEEVVRLGEELPAFVNHFQHLWFVTEEMRDALCRMGADIDVRYTESIAVDTLSIEPEVISSAIARIRRAAGRVPARFYPDLSPEEVEDYYRRPRRLVKRDRAVCAWIFTHVLPNGDVSPCLGMVAGNLGEQSFGEIWNGETFRGFRRTLGKRKVLPICARCCVYFRDK